MGKKKTILDFHEMKKKGEKVAWEQPMIILLRPLLNKQAST